MLTKEEKILIKNTTEHASNVRKMLEDDCKLYIEYTNKSTGTIKSKLRNTKDQYLIFILKLVLNMRYKK